MVHCCFTAVDYIGLRGYWNASSDITAVTAILNGFPHTVIGTSGSMAVARQAARA